MLVKCGTITSARSFRRSEDTYSSVSVSIDALNLDLDGPSAGPLLHPIPVPSSLEMISSLRAHRTLRSCLLLMGAICRAS